MIDTSEMVSKQEQIQSKKISDEETEMEMFLKSEFENITDDLFQWIKRDHNLKANRPVWLGRVIL